MAKPIHYSPKPIDKVLFEGTPNEMTTQVYPPVCGQVGKTGRVVGYSNLNRTRDIDFFMSSPHRCDKCLKVIQG